MSPSQSYIPNNFSKYVEMINVDKQKYENIKDAQQYFDENTKIYKSYETQRPKTSKL